MEKKVEFGLHVPPEGLTFEQMRESCLEAERAQYSLYTITDHFQNMTNPDGPTNHPLEAWTTLAGLAAVLLFAHTSSAIACKIYCIFSGSTVWNLNTASLQFGFKSI